MREELGLAPQAQLAIDVLDGHLEVGAHHEPARIITGPHGPSIAANGAPLPGEDVRRTLEAVRPRSREKRPTAARAPGRPSAA